MKHNSYPAALFLAYLAIIMVVLFPFLFLGRLFIDADATLYYYPVFDFYHQAIVNGTSFLWNPSIFLGFPTYLSQSAGFFDPLNWALFHLPTFVAYHLRLVIDFLLVCIFSYAAGRALGLSKLASFLIGPSYLIAFNWRYLSNVVIMNSLFLLPFLWYAGMQFFRAERELVRWGWIAAMGIAIGWSFISGYAQLTVYAVFLFGLFYLWYFFFRSGNEITVRTVSRYAFYGIAVVAIGGAIGVPQILPAFHFTQFTARAHGVAYEQAVYKTVEPGDLILFTMPDYLYFPYLSSGRKPLYIGALLFLLALVAMQSLLKRASQVRESGHVLSSIMWLFFFCLAASLQWSPVYYLMQKLPVFELFRFPYRWMYLGAWFLCVLGAYGYDIFYDRAKALRSSYVTYVVAFFAVTATALVLALNVLGRTIWNYIEAGLYWIFAHTVYGHGPFIKEIGHYKDAASRGIDAWKSFLSLSDPSFAIPFVVLVAAVSLLGFVLNQSIGRKTFRILGATLSLVTVLSVFMVQWPNTLPQSYAQSRLSVLQNIATSQDLNTYRTFPFMLGASLSRYIQPTYRLTSDQVIAIAEMQFETGWPNLNMYAPAAQSVDGYDPFAPSDLILVLGAAGSTHGGEEETKRLTDEEKISRIQNSLGVIGMLSGRYIITGVRLSSPLLAFKASREVSHLKGEVYLYENSAALPKWYFARQVVAKPHTTLSSLLSEVDQQTFKTHTYLDCTNCTSVDAVTSTDSIVKDISSSASNMIFSVDTIATRWLVVTESYLPGWEAYVDGASVPITRANGMLMAIQVPPGTHTVTLNYRGVLHEANILESLGISV